MLKLYPEFALSIIKELALRIKHLLNQVENLSLYSVETCLARLLLDESEEGVFHRQSWKTQEEIAGQLGTVLDVVNRNLQKLVNLGLIEVTRNHIKIIDRTSLEEITKY